MGVRAGGCSMGSYWEVALVGRAAVSPGWGGGASACMLCMILNVLCSMHGIYKIC